MNDNSDWIIKMVEEHETALFHYALKLSRNSEMAKDLVQESYLRLCRQSEKQIGSHSKEWLFRVCRNLHIDQWRKESRMKTIEPAPAISGIENDPGVSLQRQESVSELMTQLNGLPDTQQEVIRLKFQNGFSYKQIASITGHSVSHVGVLMHKGIKKLRHLMSQETLESWRAS